MYTQFHSMQAYIERTRNFDRLVTIFYSYDTPVLKSFRDDNNNLIILIDPEFMSFSRTTSRQLSRFLWQEYREDFMEIKGLFLKKKYEELAERNIFGVKEIKTNSLDDDLLGSYSREVLVTKVQEIFCTTSYDLIVTHIEEN